MSPMQKPTTIPTVSAMQDLSVLIQMSSSPRGEVARLVKDARARLEASQISAGRFFLVSQFMSLTNVHILRAMFFLNKSSPMTKACVHQSVAVQRSGLMFMAQGRTKCIKALKRKYGHDNEVDKAIEVEFGGTVSLRVVFFGPPRDVAVAGKHAVNCFSEFHLRDFVDQARPPEIVEDIGNLKI